MRHDQIKIGTPYLVQDEFVRAVFIPKEDWQGEGYDGEVVTILESYDGEGDDIGNAPSYYSDEEFFQEWEPEPKKPKPPKSTIRLIRR